MVNNGALIFVWFQLSCKLISVYSYLLICRAGHNPLLLASPLCINIHLGWSNQNLVSLNTRKQWSFVTHPDYLLRWSERHVTANYLQCKHQLSPYASLTNTSSDLNRVVVMVMDGCQELEIGATEVCVCLDCKRCIRLILWHKPSLLFFLNASQRSGALNS